jgi:hypothetical protein
MQINRENILRIRELFRKNREFSLGFDVRGFKLDLTHVARLGTTFFLDGLYDPKPIILIHKDPTRDPPARLATPDHAIAMINHDPMLLRKEVVRTERSVAMATIIPQDEFRLRQALPPQLKRRRTPLLSPRDFERRIAGSRNSFPCIGVETDHPAADVTLKNDNHNLAADLEFAAHEGVAYEALTRRRTGRCTTWHDI